MKFLIYGSKGWIGQQLKEEFNKTNINYVEGNERAVNKIELINEIISINPSHIISTIGRTHGNSKGKVYTTIDYLEDPEKLSENLRDNLFSPIALAILSNKYNIHFTYLGTGCLFQYDKNHPYGSEITGFKPNDTPNFFGSNYSLVKGYTDNLMQYFDNVLNLRIRMCLTSKKHYRNFITKLVTYDKICSIPNSMTVLPDMLPLIIDMAVKKITGTINLTNPGLITHNEILEMYKEIVDPTLSWKNMTFEEQSGILKAGRSNNYLDVSELKKLYPNLKHIKQSVRDCLIEYKKNL